ncbi:carbohydrate ABC transporter permease [Streptomyces leeuwenhoekii]|uniref:Probable ABC transporter permease protein yurN n=1 Tax=Streptomyces leeuwenhoekii TaxID=1437453 RepID=A0A0F7W6U1_STRLW|nr:sugar ABC transporter permease [Streptomyces leeuwenhoekii]CQR65592.1 Probable ABC transporter permease protein yurN [Streptomyces leeuwenhoekii]
MTAPTLRGLAAAPLRLGAHRPRHRVFAYLMVAPFFLVFALMVLAPLGYAFVSSLFRETILGETRFIGLDNFTKAFTDPEFLEGIGRVGLFMLVKVPLTVGLALVFALAFDSGRVRGAKAARMLMFVPNAVPAVVATLMWGYLYGDDFGPFAQAFRSLDLPAPHLLSPDHIFGSIVNVVLWSVLGYYMIILYTALRSVPEELYEAAALDGAGQVRIAWSIKIPAIMPSVLLCVLLALITAFQLFNEPQLLAALAPGAISSSYTPNLYVYNTAFAGQDLGYAAAMSFVLGFVIVVASYVVQMVASRKERR